MNTADERLRAAARDAAHIFPTGGEMPPLRLPDLASGHRRARMRAAMGGIGRARAWLSPLAAAAAVAAVAVVAALVTPGDQPSQRPGSSGVLGGGPGVKLTRAQIAVLTATTKRPWVVYTLADNATQALIERCMHAHGLAFYPFFESTAEAATMAALVPGVPQAPFGLAARQADGYGFYSHGVRHAAHARGVRHAKHPGAQDRPGREDKYIASLPAKARQRYLLALRGPLNRTVTVAIPGEGTGQIAAGGCLAAARRQVYGSLANFLLAVEGWTGIQGQLNAAVQADPAFPPVIAKWSACMAAHGYKYRSPENLYNRLATRIGTAPADHALEIRTAVQDYRCSQTARLIPTIRALQASHARYVSKALARNVTRITQIFAHALTVARRLHVTG
ncbi:MAG TPA: hypothetical protein VF940_03950 [Streptosporangiaceae bacterium]